MQILRYIAECFTDALDAWAGVGSDGSYKGLVADIILFVIAAMYGLFTFLLDRYTKLRFWQATLCAIAIIIAVILLFTVICLVIDH